MGHDGMLDRGIGDEQWSIAGNTCCEQMVKACTVSTSGQQG
jgi:hypothetical protein